MHIVSLGTPVARSFAQKLYLVVAGLIHIAPRERGLAHWTLAVLGRRVPFLAALHPADALLMVGLTVVLLVQGWQLMKVKL